MDKVGTAAGLMTPGSGTMHDAGVAAQELELGNYGRAAGATLLGTAGGMLDFIPGAGIAKGIMRGITGGTRILNEVLPVAGAGAIIPVGGRAKAAMDLAEGYKDTVGKAVADPTWWHGISENKLRRPLEEMSATHVPTTELKPGRS